MTALPWSLKLINGFIMDRFTFLAMGRRRIWIIGAQLVMVAGLLICALVEPSSSDILFLACAGFAVNAATTFQDVGVDGLAVDIMPDDERAQASGMMFGGQAIGIAAGTALTGAAITYFGPAAAYLTAAAILSAIILYVVGIRERQGERHLPWSDGEACERNLEIQADSWWPILKNTWRSMTRLRSLNWLPVLFSRGINYGAWTGMTPLLAVTGGGWSEGAATSLTGTAQLVAGILGLTLGAYLGHKLGPKRATLLMYALILTGLVAMLLVQDSWTGTRLITIFIFGWVIADVLHTVVALPISMMLCDRTVAATQFTLYMALGNMGISVGALLIGLTAAYGGIPTLIGVLIATNIVGMLSMAVMKVPRPTPIERMTGGEALA